MAGRRTRTVHYANGVTLSRRSDGRWRVRWYQPGSDDHGQRRERSFAVEQQARGFAERVSTDLGAERALMVAGPGEQVTWGQVFEAWLQVKRADWQPDIHTQNQQMLSKWAAPMLAEVPITEVRKEHYQRVFAELTVAGRMGSRARVRALLAQLERWASDNEYRAGRSFPVRTFPRGSRSEAAAARVAGTDPDYIPPSMRPDRVRVLALRTAIVEADPHGAWWRGLQTDVAARSGLRLGEQFALRTCHIDLDASTIAVRWQYVIRPHDRTHRKLPKNEMTRVTLTHPWMLDDLERRIAEVADRPDGPACSDCQRPACGLLFPSPHGGPDDRTRFGKMARDAYAATQDYAPEQRWPRCDDGSWRWTWHELRHHAAVSFIDELGLPISDAAALLGHSERTLLTRYYGPVDGVLDRARAAAQALEQQHKNPPIRND